MPPEQDETRARQIEALRQYITQLSEQREDPKVEVGMRLPDVTAAVQGPRRPPLSWLLVTVLLVAVALVGGVFVGAAAWSDDRPPAADPGAVTTAAPTTQTPPGVPLVATPECKAAVDRANEALAIAVRIRAAVDAGGTVASADPAAFDRALGAYREVVDRCTLRVP
jgi:hypothetical protein